MARFEVTGRRMVSVAEKKRSQKPVVLVPNAKAFSIREFCAAHRISESMYYKLREAGLGPREARALTKVIITQEAAADWRRQREAQTQTAAVD
jgi:hypothetical protein